MLQLAAIAWGQMEQIKDPAACKPAIQMILYRPCPEPLYRQVSVPA
jgi:hypothetical protein